MRSPTLWVRLVVDDFPSTVEFFRYLMHLLRAGAESIAEPFGDLDTQGRYAQVRAPDGSLIELHRFPPAPHFPGLLVAAEEG